ncbi:MAG: hypothetical protein ACC707_04440 [Thiohalomonadales bacterium]
MKISSLLVMLVFGLSMNLVSAKETSALMLASVHDQAFNMQISISRQDTAFYQSVLADSLRLLTVDISMQKGASSTKQSPSRMNVDQPGLGGDNH